MSTKQLWADSVDIILPTFNRGRLLKNAIDSVQQQIHRNWTLYICDDGSTDETAEICSVYKNDTKIKYLKLQHHGVSSARNFGLNKSTGKYIAFIDSDNTWSKEYLSRMVSFLNDYSLGAAYCAARLINESSSMWLGDFFDWQACIEQNYIDINCFIVRSENVSSHFDINLARFVDWDFILAITKNIQISYFPAALVNYCNKGNSDRITSTIYKGHNEEQQWIQFIQEKHSFSMRGRNNLDSRLAK